MKTRFCAPFALSLALAATPVVAGGEDPFEADGKRFIDVVRVLASDEMEGRGIGTRGIERAADYLEGQLKGIPLEPAFGSSYRQPFRIKIGVEMKEGNRIDGVAAEDWVPLGFSSSGSFDGEIVWLGYGIDAPPIGYEETKGIDLKGKVALMLRYEPQEKDEASPFDGRKPSRWSSLRYKVRQARERGAVAVVFVTGPLQDEGQNKVPALKNDGPESPAGLPVVQVRLSVAEKWLGTIGIRLDEFQKGVDRDLVPRSKGSTGLRLKGNVALEAVWAPAENLAGVLPGKGALAKEWVVFGAHYDHLGWGGERSMKPNEKAIHPGADDNASGTSAVLLVADRLKKELGTLPSHRSIAFALFSGEEVGLAGSNHLVENCPFPTGKIVAMLNLDMVGRPKENKVVALGSDSAEEWSAAIAKAAAAVGLDANAKGDGYGPSDQTSFFAEKIPVVHFFTGAHDQYHSPADTPDTLDPKGAARVTRLAALLGEELGAGRLTPHWKAASSAPATAGDSRGYGGYLGTVPDFAEMDSDKGGVLLADVRPGGPADLAGIRGKDRIVEMAGSKIANLYDMTFALQDHKPGETIDIVILREGKKLVLRATLGDRAKLGAGMKGATKEGAAKEGMPKEMPPKEAAAPAPRPAAPVGMPPADSKPAAFSLPPFYEGRPGPDFLPKAGHSFETLFEGEKHLKDVRQLTFGGENAEAYWSPDGRKLIFQSTAKGAGCDQVYVLDFESGESRRVSSGKGRTTCGYYDWPEGDRIVYASTEAAGATCPPEPDMSQGYVWSLYDGYDLWTANPDGSDAKRLTTTPGYDAEATWCHRGGKLVFTSVRDGDLDLYLMDEEGTTTRLTNTPGYDGGAFFTADCSEIVFRASRPEGKELEEYKALLAKGLIRPKNLEIYIMKSDGTDVRQLTKNGAANFCPYPTVDGRFVIYSSNAGSKGAREFDLWLVSRDGGEPERITTAPGFDGFPVFSPDGRWIVWGSNRADPKGSETNLFLARWVP
jgi:Tol biopolymer transport system component